METEIPISSCDEHRKQSLWCTCIHVMEGLESHGLDGTILVSGEFGMVLCGYCMMRGPEKTPNEDLVMACAECVVNKVRGVLVGSA